MSKQKYCYIIVDKENAKILVDSGRLPIYWRKEVAKGVAKDYTGYITHKISLEGLEKLILKIAK